MGKRSGQDERTINIELVPRIVRDVPSSRSVVQKMDRDRLCEGWMPLRLALSSQRWKPTRGKRFIDKGGRWPNFPMLGLRLRSAYGNFDSGGWSRLEWRCCGLLWLTTSNNGSVCAGGPNGHNPGKTRSRKMETDAEKTQNCRNSIKEIQAYMLLEANLPSWALSKLLPDWFQLCLRYYGCKKQFFHTFWGITKSLNCWIHNLYLTISYR